MITLSKELTMNEETVQRLKEWGTQVNQQFKDRGKVPEIHMFEGEAYVEYTYDQYLNYEEVKKFITGQNVKKYLNSKLLKRKVEAYCEENKYVPKHPVWNHIQFIQLAYKTMLPIRLQEEVPLFQSFNAWELYKYEGGFGFTINLEPERQDRPTNAIFSHEFVMRYPDMKLNFGLRGAGAKHEKSRWATVVSMQKLMVDILSFLDERYEECNGVATSVDEHLLKNWLYSQVSEEQVSDKIQMLNNPFRGDDWNALYRDLQLLSP